MQIGTAAPSLEELALAEHHFIRHKSIQENYSVGAFEKDALNCLNTLFKFHNAVIMVGGSGLYVDAITKGLDDFPEVDSSIRENLNKELESKGLLHLQKQLKNLDFKTFETISLDNPHRVIRALEVCIGTGQPYSSFLNKDKEKRFFKTISVGLTAERPLIYNRINERVDIMMKQGLLEEVKSLIPHKNLNALNTVGYKELFHYLEGEWELDFAISEIKKNTRRFAKRQLTWFKKNKDTFWFEHNTPIETITSKLDQIIKSQNEN
jgi:tRNA dimethylallyltransferase